MQWNDVPFKQSIGDNFDGIKTDYVFRFEL